MSIQYEHAKKGYRFVPTKDGVKEGKINSKYNEHYTNNSYRYCVPRAWITKGWIEEVKDDDNI